MKIKVKTFDSALCRHQTLCTCYVSECSKIGDFKVQIAGHIGQDASFFHFEAYIQDTKVILTESFPFSFFFSSPYTVVFAVYHHSSIEQSKSACFDQAIDAVGSGNESQLSALFSASKSLDDCFLSRRNAQGWTLLHFAAISENEKIVGLLLQLGWNCNEETQDNWTPLMLACAHSQVRCAREILRCGGIQVNKLTKRGSALHLAVRYGNFEAVLLLLNAKASTELEDFDGKIPLEVATDNEIIELIPKFQGNTQLVKYENEEKPPLFGGKLMSYHAMRVYNKTVFVYIDLDTGMLNEFATKEDFINKNTPISSCKIIDIVLVEPVKSRLWIFKSVHYLQIVTKTGYKYYYTKHQEYRDEWIRQLVEAIKYCQLHKIGVDNSNKSEFELVETGETEVSETTMEYEYLTLANFERVSEIGSGSFGTVYKVIKKDTGGVYAMKCLSKFFLNKKKMLRYAISEIKIMKELHHPFILTLHYMFQNESSLYLVLEYCEGGDLENLMERRRIPEVEAKFYIAEIILGLEYLHSLDVIYRDLKPANILLDAQGHVKLADFGLAKTFDDKEEMISTVVGTPAYISPEVICHEKLTKAVDIYSLGIVMHELLTGSIPFAEFEIDKLFSSIRNGKYKLADSLGKDARDIIKRLLERKPNKRPGFEEIKRHEYFSRINWELLATKRYMPPSSKRASSF